MTEKIIQGSNAGSPDFKAMAKGLAGQIDAKLAEAGGAPLPKPDAPPAPSTPPPAPDKTTPPPEPPKPTPALQPASKDTIPAFTKPAPAPEPPKKLANENFKILEEARDKAKQEAEAFKKQVDELNAKLAEAQNTVKTPEDYATLKAEREKYQEVLSQFYLEQSPEFQRSFDGPISQKITDVKELAGPLAAKVDAILRMDPGAERTAAMKEALADMDDDSDRAMIRQAEREIGHLQKARMAELQKARTNVEALKTVRQTEAQKAEAEELAQREQAAKIALHNAANRAAEFQELPDKPEHNALAAEAKQNIQKWTMARLKPQDQAELAVWAAYGVRASKERPGIAAYVAQLEKQVAELSNATPRPGSGGSSSVQTPAKTPKEVQSQMLARMQEMMAKKR